MAIIGRINAVRCDQCGKIVDVDSTAFFSVSVSVLKLYPEKEPKTLIQTRDNNAHFCSSYCAGLWFNNNVAK